MGKRAALLIYTSQEDAQRIRERATLEHRTVSGYVLNILLRTVAFEETLYQKLSGPGLAGISPRPAICPPGPKTTMLLRCSAEHAQRIRSAARRRVTSISGFVRDALWRSWSAETQHRGVTHARPALSDGGVAIQFGEQERVRVPFSPSARGLNGQVTGGDRQ